MLDCRMQSFGCARMCMMLLLITGCSSQPRLGVVDPGEKLSIQRPNKAISNTDKIFNEAIASDAKTGAGAGAVTGAAWGLACGPLAIVCAPIAAVAGAVAGGATGALVGSTRGLTDNQVKQLKTSVADYLREIDPSTSIYDAVIARASREWVLVEDGEQNVLSIEFSEVSLKSRGDGSVSLIMSLIARVSNLDASGKQRSRTATFRYESPPSPIESWTANYNEFIARRFEDGYLTLSENIVAALKKSSP